MRYEQKASWWQENPVNTEIPTLRILNYKQYTPQPPDPLIEAFARHLFLPYRRISQEFQHQVPKEYWVANRLGYPSITPDDFVSNASFQLSELTTKHAAYPDVISEPSYIIYDIEQLKARRLLKNLDDEQIERLYRAVPDIARIGFPKDFGDEVGELWENILKYYGYVEDMPSHSVNEIPPISTEINDAATARLLIVEDAREKVTALDWKWATADTTISKTQIDSYFLSAVPKVLNDKHLASPLRVLDRVRDRMMIESLAPIKITDYDTKQVMVMTDELFDPKLATYLRDWLCQYTPEQIALKMGNNPDDADMIAAKLLLKNEGLLQALHRINQYLLPDRFPTT